MSVETLAFYVYYKDLLLICLQLFDWKSRMKKI